MRFIKHIIGAVLTTALIGVPLTLTQIVYADISDISVYVNGIKTEFDEPPASENDRTLVPMRGIFEALGAEVYWDEKSETASAFLNEDTMSITIDNNIMLKNNDEIILDVPARMYGDRTLVPVRAISEAFGSYVGWDENTQTGFVDSKENPMNETIISDEYRYPNYNGNFNDVDIFDKNNEDYFGMELLHISDEQGSAYAKTINAFANSAPNANVYNIVVPTAAEFYASDEYRYPNYNGNFNDVDIFDKNNEDYFGMELLHISDEQGSAYAKTINAFANSAPNANVYNIVVPTAAEFYASDEYKTSYTPAIRKIYSQLNDNVKGINAVSPLMNHADENIYFHTDHHWTQLGAYYVYEAFINELGDDIDPYYTFDKQTISNYYGSLTRFTADTDGYDMLMSSPNALQLFSPKVSYEGYSFNDMEMNDFISNVEPIVPGFKNYNCFLGGDYPLQVYNTDVNNGRSLVIIKESYGNAFSTWALNNFETVYIVDYRKFNNYGGTNEYENVFKINEFYELTNFTDLLIISYPVSVTNAPEAAALRTMTE